jgi:hypothetical protein
MQLEREQECVKVAEESGVTDRRNFADSRVLATLRNTAISILHLNGLHGIASSLSKNCFHPELAFKLAGL